jgi:hypothetical protein
MAPPWRPDRAAGGGTIRPVHEDAGRRATEVSGGAGAENDQRLAPARLVLSDQAAAAAWSAGKAMDFRRGRPVRGGQPGGRREHSGCPPA